LRRDSQYEAIDRAEEIRSAAELRQQALSAARIRTPVQLLTDGSRIVSPKTLFKMQTKGNWATPPSTAVTKVIDSPIQLYNDYAAPQARGLLKCHQVRHRGKEMSREQRCGMRDLSALGTQPYSTVPPLHPYDPYGRGLLRQNYNTVCQGYGGHRPKEENNSRNSHMWIQGGEPTGTSSCSVTHNMKLHNHDLLSPQHYRPVQGGIRSFFSDPTTGTGSPISEWGYMARDNYFSCKGTAAQGRRK